MSKKSARRATPRSVRKKTKSTYAWDGEYQNEIVVHGERAPQLGKGKRRAKRDEPMQEPRKGDGLSRAEREVMQQMKLQQEKKTKKKQQDSGEQRDDEGSAHKKHKSDKQEAKQSKQETKAEAVELTGQQRLQQVYRAREQLGPQGFKRALQKALREGLQEQRAEGYAVFKKGTNRKAEKRKELKKKKKEEKDAKIREKQLDLLEDQRFKQKDVIQFGERVDAPPDELDVFTQQLDRMREKMERKKRAQQLG